MSLLAATAPIASPVVLVVGSVARWQAIGRPLPVIEGFQFSDFDRLDAPLLLNARPDIVLSPVLCVKFDAVELAARLGALAFTGRYRAVNDAGLDTALVRREVRESAPGIDFDILDPRTLPLP